MKLNFTWAALLLICTVSLSFYSSCKKNDLKSSVIRTPAQDSIANHVLSGLFQSLTGAYGGANINDGIKTPVNFTANPEKRVVYDVDPMCGMTIDSAYNYSLDKHDDSFHHYWGHFKFTYTCSSDHLDGYMVSDSVNYRWSGELFAKLYSVYQNFTVKALHNTYKRVSMNGATGGTTDIFSGVTTDARRVFTNRYVYDNVIVDFSSGTAVMTGTVNFDGSYQDYRAQELGDTFTGKITFTGDKTYAHLMIHYAYPPIIGAEDKTDYYIVNLITGETTPEN